MALGDLIAIVQPFEYPDNIEAAVIVNHYEQTQANDIGQSDQEAYREAANSFAAKIVGLNSNVRWWFTGVKLMEPRFYGVTKPTIGGVGSPPTLPAGTGEGLSLRSAIVVQKLSANRGRSYQGRMYLPCVSEVRQEQGILDETFEAQLQTALLNLSTINSAGLASPEFQWRIYSPTLSAAQGSIVATPITRLNVRGVLGTIRNRQRVAG